MMIFPSTVLKFGRKSRLLKQFTPLIMRLPITVVNEEKTSIIKLSKFVNEAVQS